MTERSHVYFIRNTGTGNIKIGKANDPVARMAKFQTAAAAPLELLQIIEVEGNGYQLEGALHHRFAQHRIDAGGGTEWFRPGADLLQFIDDLRVADAAAHLEDEEEERAQFPWKKVAVALGAACVGAIAFLVVRWLISHWVVIALLVAASVGASILVPALLRDRAKQQAWNEEREERVRAMLGIPEGTADEASRGLEPDPLIPDAS